MITRTLAAVTALLLLAGCTTGTTFTVGPIKTMALPTASAADTVHIKLHIEADQPAIVRYSDGVTTKTADLALQGNGDAGTMNVEFDAERPYLAVATVVTFKPGKLVCNMGATGALDQDDEDSSGPEVGSLGGTGSTVNHGTFAMCRSSEDQRDPDEPMADSHAVQLRTTATGSNDWFGWVSQFNAGEDKAEGHTTFEVSQKSGPVRLLVIPTERGDEVTCKILVDGEGSVGESTDDFGDIANCTTTVP
jgi:hypothetical protein